MARRFDLSLFMISYERTALTIWISKGVSVVCKVASLPVLLSILKTDEYAAFIILVSLESWFLLLDCGLGLSIQNFLSETFCPQEKKSQLKTALVFGGIALSLGFIFLLSLHPFLCDFLFSKGG